MAALQLVANKTYDKHQNYHHKLSLLINQLHYNPKQQHGLPATVYAVMAPSVMIVLNGTMMQNVCCLKGFLFYDKLGQSYTNKFY